MAGFLDVKVVQAGDRGISVHGCIFAMLAMPVSHGQGLQLAEFLAVKVA